MTWGENLGVGQPEGEAKQPEDDIKQPEKEHVEIQSTSTSTTTKPAKRFDFKPISRPLPDRAVSPVDKVEVKFAQQPPKFKYPYFKNAVPQASIHFYPDGIRHEIRDDKPFISWLFCIKRNELSDSDSIRRLITSTETSATPEASTRIGSALLHGLLLILLLIY